MKSDRMKAVILFAAAIVSFAQSALAQSLSLTPAAEFDLNTGVKLHHFSKYARSFIAAVTPHGCGRLEVFSKPRIPGNATKLFQLIFAAN